MKLRRAQSNKDFVDVSDLTKVSTTSALQKLKTFEYIIPKTASLKGITIVDINSKSAPVNFKAIVLDAEKVIEPTVETTLLFDLLTNYTDKEITSYSIEELRPIQNYINEFSLQRQDLFGVVGKLKPHETYRFVRNGLSTDQVFLDLIDKVGLKFNHDGKGHVLSAPYPFGWKGNMPIYDESRTTPPGAVGGLEVIRVDIRMDARDPDGDRLFFYFENLEDGSLLKDQKIWNWTPSYSDSRPTPYKLRAFISDGSMEPIELNWEIFIEDNNRPPRMKADCKSEVTEGETWVCEIDAGDPDPDDKVRFAIEGANFPEAQPLVDGVVWKKGDFFEAGKIKIEWTPNNRDFVKIRPLLTMQVVVSDYTAEGKKKNGDDVMVFAISLKGENKPPFPVAGPAGLLNWNTPLDDPPRALDTVFGGRGTFYDIDTRTANKRFFFEIVLVDLDNDSLSDPKQHDILSLRPNQGADLIRAEPDESSNMTIETREIEGQPRVVTVFRYSWQPTSINLNPILSFTPIDDMQQGQGVDFKVQLTALPRAELPSCSMSPGTTAILQASNPTSGSVISFSTRCPDKPKPSISTLSMDTASQAAQILPFLRTLSGNSAITISRKAGASEFVRTEQKYGAMHALAMTYYSIWSGAVVFSRTATCDANNVPVNTITIPSGTQLTTVFSESPYVPRVSYQTSVRAEILPGECEVIVPVTAINRSVSINQTWAVFPASLDMITQGLAARNPAVVNYDPVVDMTLTRTQSTTTLLIPEGTQLRTNEAGGRESITYVVPSDVIMNAGTSSLTIRAVRDYNSKTNAIPDRTQTYFDFATGQLLSRIPASPASGLTWKGSAIAGVTVSNPQPLFPRSGFYIGKYKNLPSLPSLTFRFDYFDGSLPALNEINQMMPNGLEPGTESSQITTDRAQTGFSQIKVRNPAWTDPLAGLVEFYSTSDIPTTNIPAGLVVATLDRKLYRVLGQSSITGTGSVVLAAQRIFEATYRPASISPKFEMRDINSSISYVGFPPGAQVYSDVETAFRIEVTDNSSNPLIPNDPFDRYYVKEYKIVTSPVLDASKVKMCREQSGPTCTLCHRNPPSPPPSTDPYSQLNLGSFSNNASRFCFFRVTPTIADVAFNYRYSIQVCDYGQSSASNESCASQTLQFYVLEPNNQPYFTSSHNYATQTPGAAIGSATAATIGSDTATPHAVPNPFNEGQNGTHTIYAYDNDKDSNNKTLAFEVLPRVYHLKPSDLGFRTTPSGLRIDPSSVVNTLKSNGQGNLARANVIWRPTDTDAKILSSSEGFIMGVRVFDNRTNASISKNQILYLKVKLANVNNTPVISSIGPANMNNTYLVNADTYFRQTFTASDLDRATPVGSNFITQLSACWNADGSRSANPFFDAGNNSPDVCHLTGPEWSSASFEPGYTGNAGVSQCRIGNALNQDLAVPKITRLSNSRIVGVNIVFDYVIEWCPQRKQLGQYSIGIKVFDNGDQDVRGVLEARKGGFAPLNLRVVAPVYLVSPTSDISGNIITKSIRQTAAGLVNNPFTYQVIAKNSKGNALTYSILSAPRSCNVANGVCINPTTGLVTWLPAQSDITDGKPETNKKISVQVIDNVTKEKSIAFLSLWVQDPALFPIEVGPSILSANPDPATNPSLKELVPTIFSVTATDANIDNDVNHDQLFAIMYVDGVAVDDLEMTRLPNSTVFLANFEFTPKAGDGSVDLDGLGPMLLGQHKLRIDVTDGNFKDSREWIIDVRNSVPQPSLALDLIAERRKLEPSISFANWTASAEVAAMTILSSKRYESLYISGSFTRAGVPRFFLWALDLVNGVVTRTGSSNRWSYNENLNWGSVTRRIAVRTNQVTMVNDIYLTNRTGKYGPFTNTTNSLQMNGDLTRYSNPLPTALACNGCANNHYSANGYGSFLVAFLNNRSFYSGGNSLLWDSVPNGPAQTVAGWPPGYTVSGIAVNPTTKRLYVSGTMSTLTANKIVVYDVAPTTLNPPQAPIKVREIEASATAAWSIQAPTMPSDIAIDSGNTKGRTPARIFVYLRGTGGLLTFTDDGTTDLASVVPATIGVGNIPSSASDILSTGLKLAYDPRSDLIWGLSREARVIFSVDPVTFEIVQKPTPGAFDGIWFLPTGSSFITERANLRYYIGQ